MSYSLEGSAVIEGQTEVLRDQRSGGAVVRRFTGIRADIDSLAASLHPSVVYRISPIGDSPCAEIIIEYAGSATPTDEPVSEVWEYESSNVSLSVLSVPRVTDALIGIPAAGLLRLRKRISTGEEPAATYHTDSGKNAELEKAVQIHDAGGEYWHAAPELVYTATYQATSGFRPPAPYQNKIYTLASLDSAFNLPSDLTPGLPTDGEWLCHSVRYSTASNGNRVFEMGFRHALRWGRDLDGNIWAYPLA